MAVTAARVARAVARGLAPAVRRWRAYWDVDHRAANFVPREELEAKLDAEREEYDAYAKEMAQAHARRDVLPRVHVDWSKGLGGITLQPRREPQEGDLLIK